MKFKLAMLLSQSKTSISFPYDFKGILPYDFTNKGIELPMMFSANGNCSQKKSGISELGIFYIFLGLLIWLPLPFGSNRLWAWNVIEIASLVMLVCWLLLFCLGKVRPPLTTKRGMWPISCLIIFCGYTLLQLLPLPSSFIELVRPVNWEVESGAWLSISTNPDKTWALCRLSIAFTILLFMAFALITNANRLKVFALVLTSSGLFQGVYGSLMTLNGAEYSFFQQKQHYIGVATGTFIDRTHLAVYLTLCFTMGVSLILAETNSSKARNWRERTRQFLQYLLSEKFVVRTGLAVVVVAIVLTKSRIGNASLFLGFFLSSTLWLIFTRRISSSIIILLASILIIDTLILGTWFGLDNVKERISHTALTQDTRLDVMGESWAKAKSQLLFGSGAGSFYTSNDLVSHSDKADGFYYTYNDYLQFLVEYGLIGCLPLIGFIGGTLRVLVIALIKGEDFYYQSYMFAPLMSIIVIAICSTVESCLQVPSISLTLIIVASLPWIIVNNMKRRVH